MENLPRKRYKIHCKRRKTIPLFVQENKRFRIKVLVCNNLENLKLKDLDGQLLGEDCIKKLNFLIKENLKNKKLSRNKELSRV